MINPISLKQKAYIASICAALFMAISFTGIYFPYKKTKVEVSLAGERFSKILIDNFNLNEQVAETISVNLLQRSKEEDGLSRLALKEVEYDETHHIYGFNTHHKNTHPQVHGTLQCVNPVSVEIYNIIKSIDYIYNNYRFDNKYMARTHYFYSFAGDCVYVTIPAPLDTYIFVPERANALKIFTRHYSYLNRKFSKDPQSKGTVSTEIYEDQLTHTNAYSVISYIYDLSQPGSERVLGALMYDNTMSDLKVFAKAAAGELDSRYVNEKLVSYDTGNEIILSGDKSDYHNPMVYDLSKKYTVMVDIVLPAFVIYNRTAFTALLLAFLTTVVVWFVLRWYVIKSSQESMTDHLTNIYNRKVLNLLHVPHPCALAVIDCNKFKFINDTYGHEMGDNALVYITNIFQQLRKSGKEIFIRLGGDEFCIVFPERSCRHAEEYLQEVLVQLKDFRKHISLSVSWGVVEWKHNESVTSAIKRADEILYAEKNKKSLKSITH